MNRILLDGIWKIRWCDGQRGGMPHFLHTPGEDNKTYLKGLVRSIDETGYDPQLWIDGSVPGEIHMDLLQRGIISSPYTGAGILQSRWVEECYWFYRKEFDAEKFYNSKKILLRLDSMDLTSIIFLNGKEIARHNNAFRPCVVDVTGKIISGKNILTVQIESGLYSVSEKNSSDYFSATMTPDILLHKRNWLRKTQSQMAWDWAPRFMNVGLTGSVSLLYDDELIVEGIYLSSIVSADLKSAKVRVKAEVKMAYNNNIQYTVQLKIAGKSYDKIFNSIPENGILEITAEIANPELWWPIGMGNQKLYNVEISIFSKENVVYNTNKQIGFRHVEVDQREHPETGRFFIFKINGVHIFMKGANMVPADIIPSSVTPARYERLIEHAIGANFNFLRVWGGGLYETDIFYELCDKKGILVWQEFIAACAVIPASDPVILEEVRAEALYQIRRLSEHPSLIAWCGNNEIGWGCKGRTDMHCGEDDILYEKIFPDLISNEDPEKYYQPTSPFSSDSMDLNDETTGDQHPWSVGFHDKDSRKYENMVCRFANEGGILGPTSMENMRKCLIQGESFGSFSWQVHDNMLEFSGPGTSPNHDLSFWTGLDIVELSLQEYVYTGGFVQGEGLKRYIETFRKQKFSSSGAVFWMYNDCWPAVRSWTIVDHSLNRTPSYHHVKRSFASVIPVISQLDGKINIFGVSDLLVNWEGQLKWGAFTSGGNYLLEEKIDVCIELNSSVKFSEINTEKIEFPILESGEAVIIYAELYNYNGDLLSRTRYTPLKYNELVLKPAKIRSTRIPGGFKFESDSFVLGVCIDLNGNKEVSDNYFDLFPGRAYEISCPDDFHLETVMSMNDLRMP